MIRVFIVGSPRGGTTVTQRLIAERGRLFTHPETQFFVRLVGNSEARFFSGNRFREPFLVREKYRARQALRLSARRDWSDLEFIPQGLNNRRVPMRRLARAFTDGFDGMARDHGLSGWVEKSPAHLHYIKEIQRYVPDARIVHIVRDGRDVVASRKDAAHHYGRHWVRYYSDILWNVDRWNNDIARSAAHVGDARHLFVDYETLCEHTHGALGIILQHIGANQQGDPGENRTRFSLARTYEKWKRDSVNGEIVKAESKWMHVFSEDERAKADGLFAPIPAHLKKALEDFRTRALEADNAAKAEGTGK